jgi:hypothetical protein
MHNVNCKFVEGVCSGGGVAYLNFGFTNCLGANSICFTLSPGDGTTEAINVSCEEDDNGACVQQFGEVTSVVKTKNPC